MSSIENLYTIINDAIDCAFTQEKYNLNFLNYLKTEKFKRDDVISFINSTLGVALQDQVDEIDLYINGGPEASYVKESYSWMGKPRARKIRNYLNKILEDAKEYEQSKRKGRKPGSKNKKSS